MKFLCVSCDERMDFAQREVPGDGTMAAVFECPGCRRAVAMLTNPMETELVSSLGVKVGGREVPSESPMETSRAGMEGTREEAFGGDDVDGPATGDGAPDPEASPETEARHGTDSTAVEWSAEAEERLGRVPSFVRGMVRRLYTDWARERDVGTLTPEEMDRARSDLGLEGM